MIISAELVLRIVFRELPVLLLNFMVQGLRFYGDFCRACEFAGLGSESTELRA